ncbi:unnamed protein product [Musa acuminata subsp. malaccensis]|uniref:(wild Malaysian banana) hypothetical protein n=1 Tax=Musa acuminata subsp. malaccensis TaxID=214687 RepID=A0A804IEJ2_MUSAM|nr:PREDICTED: protein SHOOT GRAVITROPISM 5-like [Musa acuminata subsp. malaccensis]CAG1850828.1 unnamed protein product [Musa acuminata subsp. malaccensis]
MLGSPSSAAAAAPPAADAAAGGGTTIPAATAQPFTSPSNATSTKRKRRPAGTPDPDAEVVSLSPRTLLESDRYVCEICNQGFQRDQNLQMHRRRHKVPWKLLRREAAEVRKRVFVCPEPTCLHHDPCHALGDLVGIKKHFRRKHSSHRQWVCARCSKAYAVQSDYKAHLKTCGTRGHSCDCGRVFSRVESFIEHQDTCTAGRAPAEIQTRQPTACLSTTASSSSPSSNTNTGPTMWPGLRTPTPAAVFIRRPDQPPSSKPDRYRTQGVELQLLPPSSDPQTTLPSPAMHPIAEEVKITKLQLSIGPAADHPPSNDPQRAAARLKDETMEHIKLAMAEKALADEARRQARRQHELAEQEFENAKRIRRQAQLELDRAHAIRERAVQQVDSTTALQITCYACKQQLRANPAMASEDNSFVVSYMSSVVTEGEEEHDDRKHRDKISKS